MTAERITGLALVVIGAVAAFDAFKASGWGPSGPDAGWYPFWSALTMAAAALIAVAATVRTPARGGVFGSREGLAAFFKVTAPMFAVAAAIPWLGFYLTSGLYLGGFTRWQGRYHWPWCIALAVAVPFALYLCFEQGFRVPLPKSLLYQYGVLAF